MDSLQSIKTIVEISADIEWRAIRRIYFDVDLNDSPLGEWFVTAVGADATLVLFFHGGWGKIAAAASTQFLVDHCSPSLLINLGTTSYRRSSKNSER